MALRLPVALYKLSKLHKFLVRLPDSLLVKLGHESQQRGVPIAEVIRTLLYEALRGKP